MAIIGTAEQVAAYKSNPASTEEEPAWNGAITFDCDGYKNGAMCVMEWRWIPGCKPYSIPDRWGYCWHDSIPLTKAGTVAKAQIEKRVPGNLHEVFRAALAAYKQHDKADPEFVYIF